MPQPLASSLARVVAPEAPRGSARVVDLGFVGLALAVATASGGVAVLLGLRDGLRIASLGGLGALTAPLARPTALGLCAGGLILIVLPLWAWLVLPPARRRARLGLALATLAVSILAMPFLLARTRTPAPLLSPLGDLPALSPASSGL